MSSPVRVCGADEELLEGLRRMVFSDVHRIFVYDGREDRVVGVLSLSDVARLRSGTCRACISSRISPDS
jgi:predicted transcriptional regulator